MNVVCRLLFCVLALALPSVVWAESPTPEVDYERDVKPILQHKCVMCHGRVKQEGGLRLDTASLAKEGGYSGPAVVAGDIDKSTLIAAVLGTGDTERMPLEAKPLDEKDIEILKSWVASGAEAPDEPIPESPDKHWAFQVPVRPEVPAVAKSEWVRNPIDAFIAAEHEQRGLSPLAEIDKNLLLRRVYVDLVGYPPTRAEVQAFLADTSPDAYEKVVDRLLASPQYGQRWARHWMDVWRYSDWDGFGAEVRESQPHIWRWRDWIIQSLNEDKPYDRMIVEMLAGDEIAPNDPQTLRATGYLVRNWFKFNRNVWLENTVEHTGKAFLGITLNCAKCHDHMYDPISQKNHFQFRAFFEAHDVRTDSVYLQEAVEPVSLVRVYDSKHSEPTYLFERGNEAKPVKDEPLSVGLPAVFDAELKVEPVELPLAVYYPGSQPAIRDAALAKARAELEAARGRLKAATGILESATAAGTSTVWLQLNVGVCEKEVAAAQAAVESVQARIAADDANYATPPAPTAKELSLAAGASERKLALLQAEHRVLVAEGEALQARSAAQDDEGKKKTAEAEKKLTEAKTAVEAARTAAAEPTEQYARFSPVYPNTSTGRRTALARWIADAKNPLTARVAINHMWLRHFGSPLVATVFDFGLNGKTPTHPELLDWLAVELVEAGWRMKPIHRMLVTSSAYRMQSSSGDGLPKNREIDPDNHYLWRMNVRRMEAEAVRDSALQVAGKLDLAMHGPDLDPGVGLTNPRRSIYFRASKEKGMTFLSLFDRANVADCYKRNESIVPQQALAMANSSLLLEQSRTLASALSSELGAQAEPEVVKTFIETAFWQVLSRGATPAELEQCIAFVGEQTERFKEPAQLTPFTAGDPPQVPPAADPHQRARESLVHVLLNHNDFLTVR